MNTPPICDRTARAKRASLTSRSRIHTKRPNHQKLGHELVISIGYNFLKIPERIVMQW